MDDILEDEVGLALLYHEQMNAEVMKMADDHYHFYVNGDFVGTKELENQPQEVFHLTEQLEGLGIPNLITQIHGDNYLIHVNEPDVTQMKQAISPYFN